MKINLKTFKSAITIVGLLFIGIIISCKEETLIEDPSTARSFTPSGLTVRTVKDSAIFNWKLPLYGSGKALTYTLELSKDSLFSVIDYSRVTDTTGALFTDLDIAINTPYFYRLKVNQYNETPESRYLFPGKAMRITGQQYLRPIRDFEIGNTSVLLHWLINSSTAGIDKAVLKSKINEQETTVDISTAEAAAGQKLITGLLPGTSYTVQLLAGRKSKGLASIITAAEPVFTTVLNPTDNLATAIANAVSGDVIGLNPGTYTLSSATFIVEKSITIRSVSNNPADTKIKSRELNPTGNGAGITLIGLDIDGNYSGTSNGTTVFQLYGTQTTNSAAAEFGDIKIDNCVIHDYLRCIVRGNYGSAALVQKAGKFSITNSIIYNIDKTYSASSSGYYMFSLEKLQFTSITVSKSTFYQMGEGLVNMSTTLTGAPTPTISFDYCTFNAFGGNNKYLFVDANANKVNFSITNSILANTGLWGSLNAAAQRSAAGSSLTFNNNNYFKLLVTAPNGAGLNLSTLGIANPYSIDLGWGMNTTNFALPQSTTDPSAALFTASTNSSTIGDPRWAY